MGGDGLRHTPADCRPCGLKTECLRSAVQGSEGIAVHEERLARAYQAGAVGFLDRWAQQKGLERRKKREGVWTRFWRGIRGKRC